MTAIAAALAAVVGDERFVHGPVDAYLKDETETRRLVGSCAAVVEPRSAEEVARSDPVPMSEGLSVAAGII
jgi:hypothetical protein